MGRRDDTAESGEEPSSSQDRLIVTSYDIEKLDNVTWYGHCVIHVMAAISDLPDEAKLVFCQDLEKFIRRQERVLSEA